MSAPKQTLRGFAVIMMAVLVIVALLASARQKYGFVLPFLSGASFFFAGFFYPPLLAPLYVLWMRLVYALGWINTRILLAFVFYLVFSPIGLVLRLLRVDPLDRRIENDKPSYWRKKEKIGAGPSPCERQF